MLSAQVSTDFWEYFSVLFDCQIWRGWSIRCTPAIYPAVDEEAVMRLNGMASLGQSFSGSSISQFNWICDSAGYWCHVNHFCFNVYSFSQLPDVIRLSQILKIQYAQSLSGFLKVLCIESASVIMLGIITFTVWPILFMSSSSRITSKLWAAWWQFHCIKVALTGSTVSPVIYSRSSFSVYMHVFQTERSLQDAWTCNNLGLERSIKMR